MFPRQLLAADIGGTHSRFAHFLLGEEGDLKLVRKTWIKTRDFSGLAGLLGGLQEEGFSLSPREADFTVLAVKGPVIDGLYCSPPGLDWTIDLSHAEKDFGMKDFLMINDFVAQAFATRSPVSKSAMAVLKGESDPNAATLAIGAGTGLGKSALISDGRGSYIALPSEGGHALFPFVSPEEDRYRRFLKEKVGDVGLESDVVVSGRGIALLHHFLSGEELSPEEAANRLVPGSETLEWMGRFYGRVCRDSALEFLARGGLFVAGGVAGRKPDLVTCRAFAEEFRRSTTMTDILEHIPVFLMTDTDSGLWGAAFAGGLHLFSQNHPKPQSFQK